jgi:chemotaxis protein CheC
MTPMQKDAMKELANIGTGHAARALSELVGKRVDMAVPLVEQISLEEVSSHFGHPETVVCAILARCETVVPSNLVFIMPEEDSGELAEEMLGLVSDTGDFDRAELAESALSEAGNIILSAFMSALGDMLGVNLPLSVPAVAHDMLGSIMDIMIAIFGVSGDTAFLVNTPLTFPEDSSRIFSGRILMVPDPDALEGFFGLLGVA